MQQAPSAYTYQQSSPLETLVRRASSRKVAAGRPGRFQRPADLNLSRTPSPSPPSSPTHNSQNVQSVNYTYEQEAYGGFHTTGNGYAHHSGQEQLEAPHKPVGSQHTPASPLLHTQFRSSTATTLTQFDNTYGPDPSQYTIPIPQERGPRIFRDDESVYSEASYARTSVAVPEDDPLAYPAPRFGGRARPDTVDDFSAFYRQSQFTSNNSIPPPLPHDPFAADPVPMVVVSEVPDNRQPSAGGRARSAANISNVNYSRPRGQPPAGAPPSVPSSPAKPELPPRTPTEESKRLVIERNLHRVPSNPRLGSGTPRTPGTPGTSYIPGTPHTPGTPYTPGVQGPPRTPGSPYTPGSHGTPPSLSVTSSPRRSPSPNELAAQNGSPSRAYSRSPSPSLSPSPNGSHTDLSRSASPNSIPRGPDGRVTLSGRPPSPANGGSPSSPYSTYSFYELQSPSSASLSAGAAQNGAPRGMPSFQVNGTPVETPGPPARPTAEDYLQLGITSHEADRLKESASYFELSAKEGGGCGAGMLMWGLTLRHGWGVPKDEKTAFKWLRRAAESATGDLEQGRVGKGQERDALKKELILAIYEVGQCFFHGWGVPKDQKMAVSYFTTAARLGDPDAQQELAFCLLNGKGCKKDRKEAAKWYRAAVAQGASDVGLAWIYKAKLQ